MKRILHHIKLTGNLGFRYGLFMVAIILTSCSKVVQVTIPPNSQQVVVDGSIQNGVPPIILLSKSQQFFGTVNLNNLGAYFVHGASVKVSGSDGTQIQLVEFCLGDLNLPTAQTQQLLSALGYTTVDSANALNICAYTVPDIINYYTTGTCSYMGKLKTAYQLTIATPPIAAGQHDSIHLSANTTIPYAIGLDSLAIRPDPSPTYADSFAAVYVYVTVPDTFGNFIRYETKVNSQPFYTGAGGSVYDDRLFVGRSVDLPVERGLAPNATFNLNTDLYFNKGDTVTVMWSNIDVNTYNFFYTLENDGGNSPFSSPVKIIGNVNNGLGCFAGYGAKYYTIIVPK
jgi:hypothetical protein